MRDDFASPQDNVDDDYDVSVEIKTAGFDLLCALEDIRKPVPDLESAQVMIESALATIRAVVQHLRD